MGKLYLGVDQVFGKPLRAVHGVAEVSCVVVGAERLFEGESLVVAFTLPL